MQRFIAYFSSLSQMRAKQSTTREEPEPGCIRLQDVIQYANAHRRVHSVFLLCHVASVMIQIPA